MCLNFTACDLVRLTPPLVLSFLHPWCYHGQDKVLVFLLFHVGKALASCRVASWKFYEFCVNFPSSSSNSVLGDS